MHRWRVSDCKKSLIGQDVENPNAWEAMMLEALGANTKAQVRVAKSMESLSEAIRAQADAIADIVESHLMPEEHDDFGTLDGR